MPKLQLDRVCGHDMKCRPHFRQARAAVVLSLHSVVYSKALRQTQQECMRLVVHIHSFRKSPKLETRSSLHMGLYNGTVWMRLPLSLSLMVPHLGRYGTQPKF